MSTIIVTGATAVPASIARPSTAAGRRPDRPHVLPLARRRTADGAPDPQAPPGRPLASAFGQAVLVGLGRPPYPERSGLHRHRLRQSLRLRAGGQAKAPREPPQRQS